MTPAQTMVQLLREIVPRVRQKSKLLHPKCVELAISYGGYHARNVITEFDLERLDTREKKAAHIGSWLEQVSRDWHDMEGADVWPFTWNSKRETPL